MTDSITIEGPALGKGKVCRMILADLPEWFGIEEANHDYATRVENLPTFVAKDGDKTIGFMSLLKHTPRSAELYVLGVQPAYHRRGIGKKLLAASERYLKTQGVIFVQVKTLASEAGDVNYDKTRAFYQAQGYVPLEVFPELWDTHNPCLQMIKYLAPDKRN